MKAFIEITFLDSSASINEILIAELAELGYDGFLEENDQLTTYIDRTLFNEDQITHFAHKFGVRFMLGSIEEQNWNAAWEKSFEPVVIEDKLAIRASFHQSSLPSVQREIVITPKMSFGTGHHATTYLMVKQMLELSFSNKKVLDFGTGTGILAILAEMQGASTVLGIDNDEWSMDNARENVAANHCHKIQLELMDTLPNGQTFDVILANINRHILLEHASSLVLALEPGGSLLLSGILTEDREVIVSCFGKYLGEPIQEETERNWMMIRFTRP